MEHVSQSDVVRHWLRVEQEDPTTDLQQEVPTERLDVDGYTDDEALDTLLRLKPGAAAFIWRDEPIDWYHVELSRREFLALHVVDGPEHLYWRALSPDNTIRGAAQRIEAGEPDQLAAATGVDVGKVLTLRDELPAVADQELVLATRQGCRPWTIADGNYRAVAKALALLDDGAYTPQTAYLGVGANPIGAPLRERVCGLGRHVRSTVTDPSGRLPFP